MRYTPAVPEVHDPLAYRRRLRPIAAALTLAEIVVVVGPLWALVYPLPPGAPALLARAVPVVAAIVIAVYLPLARALFRPIDRAIAEKRRGVAITPETAQAAYTAILQAPRRIGWLRSAAWCVGILGVALTLRARTGFADLPVVLTVSTLHPYAVSVVRSLAYARVMRELRGALLPNVDPITLAGQTYFERIVEVGIATGAIGVGATALFVYYFIPISLEAYKALEVWFAPTVAGLTLLWYFAIRRLPKPIADYLATRDYSHAQAAYRDTQALPLALAASKLLAWLGAGAALAAQSYAFGVEGENALLMFAVVVIVAVGAAQFEALWHRASLRPLLQHLAARHRLQVGEVPPRLGLRAKMLGGFGGLMVFACGLSMLWSFVQYRVFAQEIMRRDGETELARARADLILRGARTPEDVVAYLAARGDANRALEFVPRGQKVAAQASSASLDFQGQFLGSLVAHPASRIHLQRQIGALSAFFVALLALSAGLILILVRDLTEPVRQLEQRAVEMARGELMRPVVATGDADEIGRLTFAFEEMRRALRDKLRSTESLSVALEREVMRRTEDLEVTNRELRATLETLQRAQDELVRSEKLASMGRLVAGIAHEINNPVNAMVNSLAPLEESLGDRLGQIPAEIREMFDVVHRGAARTKAIVQALHSYSRGDSERRVEMDLHRGLDESLELLRHHLKKGITVERNYGAVGRVTGYAGQLQQVFMNLLTNAAQALAEREGGGRIVIQTARVGKDIVITIADDGPGIPPEILPRIFDPFFTTKDVGQGSGLGLSIVHGIVERHGGRIDVDSQVGRGTTFTVTLPGDTVA
jgi:signal transduction histidine kinase